MKKLLGKKIYYFKIAKKERKNDHFNDKKQPNDTKYE